MLVSQIGFLLCCQSLFEGLGLVDVVGLERHVEEVGVHVKGRGYCYLRAVLVFLRGLFG